MAATPASLDDPTQHSVTSLEAFIYIASLLTLTQLALLLYIWMLWMATPLAHALAIPNAFGIEAFIPPSCRLFRRR